MHMLLKLSDAFIASEELSANPAAIVQHKHRALERRMRRRSRMVRR